MTGPKDNVHEPGRAVEPNRKASPARPQSTAAWLSERPRGSQDRMVELLQIYPPTPSRKRQRRARERVSRVQAQVPSEQLQGARPFAPRRGDRPALERGVCIAR